MFIDKYDEVPTSFREVDDKVIITWQSRKEGSRMSDPLKFDNDLRDRLANIYSWLFRIDYE